MREKKLSNTNFLASRQIKRDKASLPVDVRRSKTSLLKFPIIGRGDLGCLGFRTFDSSLNSKGGVVVQWLVLVTRYQDVQV